MVGLWDGPLSCAANAFVEHSCLGKDFLYDCLTDGPQERALKLENHSGLEQAYAAVAAKGDSAVPSSAEDEVDYHYICFVRSDHDGCLYELDGDSKGPVCLGPVDVGEYGDILRPDAISQIRKYIDQEESGNIGYSLMALVHHGILE
jgi:ubiquitin carboxyl-terminal hydrolase L3